jgi:hypothetical protein
MEWRQRNDPGPSRHATLAAARRFRMDGSRFDTLTRTLSACGSRRRLLRPNPGAAALFPPFTWLSDAAA